MNIRDKRSMEDQKNLKVREKQNYSDKSPNKRDPMMYSSNGIIRAGPVDFDERIAQHEGGIMAVASKDVVTIPPTTTIIAAIKTMTGNGFRRVPVTDAGTNRLEGIVTSVDVIDFLGGGSKNLLVENHYKGNLLAAVNASVKEIMQYDAVSISNDIGIDEAIRLMLDKNAGGLPVVDDEGHVLAICTEKDFLRFAEGVITAKKVAHYMSRKVKHVTPKTSIGDVAKMMIDNGFRRVPLIKNGDILGMVTASDIMRFIGSGDAFHRLMTGNVHEALNEPVDSLISKKLVSINIDADMGNAARLMLENNIGSLPVMDNDELAGIITERDFLKAMSE
ncbi:CBS domain-containing protein [Methanolobus halotolerans]|uniref:CBS domain-containing protein n=1 Tax=Methanolobus halotolerans TaxID=2052935 RepID=A0A4E0QCM2_9EURY|nr:CBS domain-containing protein [Methanolobus halotolerans]TGC11007.1 CBS domain-containing protein [Methanolobus halotolerans]